MTHKIRSSLRLIAIFALLLAASGTVLYPGATAQAAVTGAAFTTVNEPVDNPTNDPTIQLCLNGNPDVNCNIYTDKSHVWLNGGPSVAYVGAGTYFFAVLVPGGQPSPKDALTVPDDGTGTPKNLSDDFDSYQNRTFMVGSNGNITSYSGSHDFANNKIRLMPYSDTTNPGGVYILAICSLANGYPVDPSSCKYDAFKIQQGQEVQKGLPLTVTKDANGAYNNTYTWNIKKSVDKTLVKQVGGSVTFNYTVSVSHDSGTIGGVKVTGTIEVINPNVDSQNNPVAVTIDGVTDQLSDGTNCTVTNGGPQDLTQVKTYFGYECDLSSVPLGELDNTVTVTWPEQLLDNGALLDAGSEDFTFSNISFTENQIDECANVTDSYAGSLGTACVGDANPKSFTYQRTITVPQFDCQSYDNTATFTTNDTGATGSASKTVTVCGPAKTGALTMGFWQNKNGQGIITGGASVSGVCKSGTWLRQYAPFQDLSATATCSQVATYVYNAIKVATCTSTSKTCNSMLKAQMLATALDVYFSDPTLGGNKISAPAPIGGVSIDLTMICKMIDSSSGSTCGGKVEDASSAFGGSPKTVLQMLSYAASQSNAGGSTWYGNMKSTQVLAKDAFDAINNLVAFAP